MIRKLIANLSLLSFPAFVLGVYLIWIQKYALAVYVIVPAIVVLTLNSLIIAFENEKRRDEEKIERWNIEVDDVRFQISTMSHPITTDKPPAPIIEDDDMDEPTRKLIEKLTKGETITYKEAFDVQEEEEVQKDKDK